MSRKATKVTTQRFLDITQNGFFRAAAVSPLVYLGLPMENALEHYRWARKAYGKGAQLIVFPELSLTGYTLQDVFHQEILLQQTDLAIKWFLKKTRKIQAMLVFGAPILIQDQLYNSLHVAIEGKVVAIFIKTYRPNYDPHTEPRWFASAMDLPVKEIFKFDAWIPVGNDLIVQSQDDPNISITFSDCEDNWMPIPPNTINALHGAKIVAHAAASPFEAQKVDWRRALAQRSGIDLTFYISANTGHGESGKGLVFPHDSLIYDRGVMVAEMPQFEPLADMIIADGDLQALSNDRRRLTTWGECARNFRDVFPSRTIYFSGRLLNTDKPQVYQRFYRKFDPQPFVGKTEADTKEIFMARAMGLLRKLESMPPALRKIVIGESGGKDSADITLLAVYVIDHYGEMLGMTRKDIIGITMPGFGTSDETFDYATALCAELGITFYEQPVTQLAQLLFEAIGEPDIKSKIETDKKLSLVFESIQVFVRKTVELAFSAALGGFDLGSTSNSEALIGWFNVGGDGFAHYSPNLGLGKSQVPVELEWLADTYFASNLRLASIVRGIARSASTPENLPRNADGVQPLLSDEINGPNDVRDFIAYYMFRFRKTPASIYRLLLETYSTLGNGSYEPHQLYAWQYRFTGRVFRNWYKMNIQAIDAVRVGAISPSAHDSIKMPSDLNPHLWLQNLEQAVPKELQTAA